tara:strand:+ start:156 stop:359 length:204 start_codon:yes stop_codon:yes gene_type:complete
MEKSLIKVERVGEVRTDINGNDYCMLYPEPTLKGNVFTPSTPKYVLATMRDALVKAFESDKGLFIAI